MQISIKVVNFFNIAGGKFFREHLVNFFNSVYSIFAHIRNSIAHCRYNVVDVDSERVYCFEDVEPKMDSSGNVKVSARIVLYESTLIKWIELIEGGEIVYNYK